MGALITILLLLLGSFSISYYSDKKIELALPLYSCLIIFFLFVFYMLNIINVGYYLIIGLTLISFIYCLIMAIRKKKLLSILKLLFTPGFFVFIVVALIILYIVKDNMVLYFDELRMWAAYPKTIYYTGKAALPGNPFMQTTYFPGMPLWQYFIEKNNFAFTTPYLYWAYSLLTVIFMLPVLYKVEWKKFYLIIPALFIFIYFPMLFANSWFDCIHYYKTLFIDPILGFGFGFAFWLSTRDVKKSKAEYILLCLAVCVTMLFKITGVVLVVPVICNFIWHQLFVYKNIKLKKILPNLAFLLTPLLLLVFTYFSWNICVNHFNKAHNAVLTNDDKLYGISAKDSIQIIIRPSEQDKTFAKKYIETIKNDSLIITSDKLSKYMTVNNLTLIFVLSMFLITVFSKKGYRFKSFSSGLVGVGIILLYMLFYYVVYSLQFNRVVLCYGRYISTLFSGLSLFLLLYLIDNKDNYRSKSLYYFVLTLFIPILLMNYRTIGKDIYREDVIDSTSKISKLVEKKIGKNNKKTVNILTVQNTCDTVYYTCVLVQHHLYYKLMDDNILVSEIEYLAGEVTDPLLYDDSLLDDFTIKKSLEGIDYIVVTDDIVINKDTDKEIFNKKELSFGTIYKVSKVNGKYVLEEI